MLNSANSCRVYSLIPEQNILVAVVVIFSILACHPPHLHPLPHPQSPPKAHTSHPCPYFHAASERMVSVDSHRKRWVAPWRNVWVTQCCKGWVWGSLLALALTPASHTAQTLCRPDSIKACHGSRGLVESGLLLWWTQRSQINHFKCVLSGSVTSKHAFIYENKHMPSAWSSKGREDPREKRTSPLTGFGQVDDLEKRR